MSRTTLRFPKSQRTAAVVLALSTIAHGLLLSILWLKQPAISMIDDGQGAQTVIPVVIDTTRRPARRPSAALEPAGAAATLRHAGKSGVAATPSDQPPPPVVAPAAGEDGLAPGPPRSAPSPDLSRALQRGLVNCADVARLPRADRERCAERLAAGARQAPQLPLSIEPRIRTYYDAIAAAKAPDRQPVPLGPPGSMLDADMRGMKGHGPSVGCAFTFGSKGVRAKAGPPHALKLGPCFIAPPAGSLSRDVDVPPP